jgi:hypothetical protein
MQKIHYELAARLRAVKTRAEGYSKHNPEGAYKSALEWQVKYGRPGWRAYESANSYNEAGDLCLYNLADFDPIPLQDISRRAFDYMGYYADNFECEIVRPYIVKIKTSRGAFICPAIDYSDSDQATIYISRGQLAPSDPQDTAHECAIYDAARIADSIAERLGDQGRECDAQYQAEQQADDLKDDNKQALKEARALVQAIREQRHYSNIMTPICDLLADKLRELRASIRRNNARIAALNDDFWLAVN